MEDKYKILVVDDAEINRSILADMLSYQYSIIEAANGLEAISILESRHFEISLILLDIMMPQMDGFEVLSIIDKSEYLKSIPVIMISAETSSAYIDRAYDLGATDYINRPFDEKTVKRRVKNTILLYTKQKALEDIIERQYLEKEQRILSMVEILSNMVEFRNSESSMHVIHVRSLSELLLQNLVHMTDKYSMNTTQIFLITNASCLHDIGKISIPENILNKPGNLTKEEYEVMKTHAATGAAILKRIPGYQEDELMQTAHDICRWHHERYDGNGYPDRLKGEEIPISAQVVAMADVYDALTNERIYKPAYSNEEAIRIIMAGECGAFNPLLLQCLKQVAPHIDLEKGHYTTMRPSPFDMYNIFSKVHNVGSPSSRTMNLLEQERTKYHFFASMAKEILFEYSLSSDLLTFSDWGANKLGIKDIIAHPQDDEKLRAIWNAKDTKDLVNRLQQATKEYPVVQATYALNIQGECRWHKVIARPLWADSEREEKTGIVGKLIDIHEEHQHLEALKVRAEEDSLTNLYNHKSARKWIELALNLKRSGYFALMIIDLDHFKAANDQYGHMFGDSVLKEVAHRIQANIREADIASRIGGDEFLIFFSLNNEMKLGVKHLFEGICGAFEQFDISISMGISIYPVDGADYESLFRQADQALYYAKQSGRQQYCFYASSMRESSSNISPMDSYLG